MPFFHPSPITPPLPGDHPLNPVRERKGGDEGLEGWEWEASVAGLV